MKLRPTRSPDDRPGTAAGGAIAQRPRLTNRLRLVPLALLAVAALGVGVIGRLDDTPLVDPAIAVANAQQAADKAAAKGKKKCTPAYDDGRSATADPWGPGRAKASEKIFKSRIKKENAAYVKGRGGFAFFTDYQSEDFSQSIGRVTQTKKQERGWAKFFVKLQKTAAANGGDLRVVIAPSKGDVYRQNLPAWATPLRGETSLERLIADYPEVPWIDTRSALRKASGKNDTYEALNSHWTPYGGYVAWDAITKCLALTPTFTGVTVPPITGVTTEASLNEFAPQGVKSVTDRTLPLFAGPHPAYDLTSVASGAAIPKVGDDSVDMTVLPAITTTTGAQNAGSLLLLRDSTGSAISPLASTSFAKTIQYSHGLGTQVVAPKAASLISQYKPTLTLFVMTERYLNYPAPK